MDYLDCLVYLQPAGLLLDIVGFWVVIRHGHALLIRTGTGPRPKKLGDGTMYFQHENGGSDGEASYFRRRRRAEVGVALVMTGFIAQLIAAAASVI